MQSYVDLPEELSVMTITVLIPTYRRPQDLARCLEALQKQTRLADEVLLVVILMLKLDISRSVQS